MLHQLDIQMAILSAPFKGSSITYHNILYATLHRIRRLCNSAFLNHLSMYSWWAVLVLLVIDNFVSFAAVFHVKYIESHDYFPDEFVIFPHLYNVIGITIIVNDLITMWQLMGNWIFALQYWLHLVAMQLAWHNWFYIDNVSFCNKSICFHSVVNTVACNLSCLLNIHSDTIQQVMHPTDLVYSSLCKQDLSPHEIYFSPRTLRHECCKFYFFLSFSCWEMKPNLVESFKLLQLNRLCSLLYK